MKRTLATQYFRCTRLTVVLTRASCARNHQLAHRPLPTRGADRMHSAASYRCKDCPVGAEHERGKTSTPPVQIVQVRVERPESPPRRCLACGHVLEHGDSRKSYCGLACYAAGMRLAHIERLAEVSL